MANEVKNQAPTAKAATPAKTEEKKETVRKTRKERFMELAPQRTRGVLKLLEVLGNCSNRDNYEYEEAQVQKIFEAIDKKVKDVRAKFSAAAKKETETFTL